jgi:hypothetical protein
MIKIGRIGVPVNPRAKRQSLRADVARLLDRARPVGFIEFQGLIIEVHALQEQALGRACEIVHLDFGRSGELRLRMGPDKGIPQIGAAVGLPPQHGCFNVEPRRL